MAREDLQVASPLGTSAQFVEDSEQNRSRLALTKDGNIGIATDTPESQLHVKGDVRIRRSDKIILGDQGNGVGEWIQNVTKNGFGISFYGNSRERVRITNGGNVGVGTTNPQGALDVTSASGALIVPRMTTQQRDSLPKIEGSIIYNTDTRQFDFYENGRWEAK